MATPGFSSELLAHLQQLQPHELRRAENVLRAALDLDFLPRVTTAPARLPTLCAIAGAGCGTSAEVAARPALRLVRGEGAQS